MMAEKIIWLDELDKCMVDVVPDSEWNEYTEWNTKDGGTYKLDKIDRIILM